MKHTALLVIDLQRGAFDGARAPVIAEPERLITNAVSLVRAARQSSLPVLFVQHCEGAGELFEEGTVHALLHESLAPQPDETVLKKHASNAFENTALEKLLRDLNARELVVCGLQSEFCIASTAKAALDLGFGVIIASDAHSTWPSKADSALAISDRVNRELSANGAALRSTAELVQALQS